MPLETRETPPGANEPESPKTESSLFRNFSLRALVLVMTCCALFVIWRQYKYERGTINDWIDQALTHESTLDRSRYFRDPSQTGLVPCPIEIPPEAAVRLLVNGTRWLQDEQHRTCTLKLLVENYPDLARDELLNLAANSSHTHLRRDAILLVSLYRNPDDIPVMTEFLDERDDNIRAAAIDALSIIHKPAFPLPAGYDNTPTTSILFNSNPPVELTPLREFLISLAGPGKPLTPGTKSPGAVFGGLSKFAWVHPYISYSPELELRLREMLIDEPSGSVRSAAARALLAAAGNRDKPQPHFRFAEWGVWINSGDSLQLADSVLDEIPEFVHRVGNSIEAISANRSNSMIIVTKPVVHIEVDEPTVIDLSVGIHGGVVAFGYPRPDDFTVRGDSMGFGGEFTERIEKLQNRLLERFDFEQMNDMRSGYPWISPLHPREYATSFHTFGFRWQTLVALPEKAEWMVEKKITDEKYLWWSRLREVPSSWISNRGESERFLYYDGPTVHKSPSIAELERDRIKLSLVRDANFENNTARHALYIHVENGRVHGISEPRRIFNRRITPLDISTLTLEEDEVEQNLLFELVEFGLKPSEARGLIDCWRPQFFETDGRRLLMIIGKKEYDQLCPMTITPIPTELERVGIILHEFGE